MKQLLLSTLFVIPTILCAYQLEFNKSFNKEIQNDRVHTNLSISVNSKEIAFINEKIEFFQDFIKEDKSVVKKNGNYSVVPNYAYENNKQIFLGYKGILDYGIETSKYENLNQFISAIITIKNNMNTNRVKLSVSNIEWIVSTEIYEKNIDQMRSEAIDWIKEYSRNLSDNCSIQNISINKSNEYTPRKYAKNLMMESSSSMSISPIQTKHSIILNANFKLECNK
jgi:predicted secreted protein